jgi:hypothetical protein
MKPYILLLIQDDIKITTLIGALENLRISARDYHLNNSTVIFHLMGIPETEEQVEAYCKLIESGKEELINNPKELQVFAKAVYTKLLAFVEPS